MRQNAITLIHEERIRQIKELGYTEHIDAFRNLGELSMAAVAFLKADELSSDPPSEYPWHKTHWNPSADRLRNLIKAGALVAAEIDKLLIEREKEHGRHD